MEGINTWNRWFSSSICYRKKCKYCRESVLKKNFGNLVLQLTICNSTIISLFIAALLGFGNCALQNLASIKLIAVLVCATYLKWFQWFWCFWCGLIFSLPLHVIAHFPQTCNFFYISHNINEMHVCFNKYYVLL